MRYIHEQPDWPRFRWDIATLTERLAEVRARQGRLLGRVESLGFPLRREAHLDALTDDAQKSSEIEGERFDREEVRSSLARRLGMDFAATAPVNRNVDGIVEITIDATENARAALTRERMFGWHAALFPTGWSGLRPIAVGRWREDRTGPMRVVSGPIGRERVHFEAPPAGRLDEEMAAFLEWFEAGQSHDPVLNSALAHLWFVTIHPFDDGNGRIARAIADVALARSEITAQRFYSMSAQICGERAAYYRILETTQRGSLNVTAWMQWFLDCLDRSLEHSESAMAAVLRKARFWDEHESALLNERQRQLVNRLLDGFEGKLTSSKWAKIAKCSHDTALRDIQGLVAAGILRQEPARGRSTSYALLDERP